MRFDRVRDIADAVLLEGYALYPYRASATKNRYRWAFGILAPRSWSEVDGTEPWWMETQCLIEGSPKDLSVEGMLRFLHIQKRTVERRAGDGTFEEVEALESGGQLHVPWEEGVVRELPFSSGGQQREVSFDLGGSREVLALEGGRVLRQMWDVSGRLSIGLEALGHELSRLTVRVENLTPWAASTAPREEALRSACISTHLLLSVEGGAFISTLDPPAWAKDEVAGCENVRAFPVLAGAPGKRDLLLASPIILYDHPAIAPESPGDFFDGTEIDELLVLRTSTLTEKEKREARATSERTAALLDRVEGISEEDMAKLHGAIRQRPLPLPQVGEKVRFSPHGRRTDAQDLLYAGCVATVEKILQDVDGQHFLAVTLDLDPAADLHRDYGRFHYFYLDEVERLR